VQRRERRGRLGNEYLYQSMAQACVEQMNGYEVKKIIVNCPHCFNHDQERVPAVRRRYEVIHAAELLAAADRRGQAHVPRLRQAHRVPRLPATTAASTRCTTSRARC
jgi:Fe-S oxidoreductase